MNHDYAIEIARQGDTEFKGVCVNNHDLNSWKKRISRRDQEVKYKNNYPIPPGPWDTDLDNYHDPKGYDVNFGDGYCAKIMRNTATWAWKFELITPITTTMADINTDIITFMYNGIRYKLKFEQNIWNIDLSEYDLLPLGEYYNINKHITSIKFIRYSTFNDIIEMIKICINILNMIG
jgi:hypothetical protein